MNILVRSFLYISVAALAVYLGLLLQNTKVSSEKKQIAQNKLVANDGASLILSANLPDLKGQNQEISQWKGKVLIVNFWATWCEPCRREMPEFINLQNELRDQGLLFIGIATDQKNKVQQYSREIGVNYPVLLGGIEAMELAEAAGNHHAVLPFTVILNRNGEIASTHIGRITREKIETVLKPLL
ncbi:MAG: thioredoxin [Nitrosomonadaceae bacterium]|nr:thioredoxin [Nitrosomonadaceae bacterium]|tara:strand:- start:336 stop:890 length:555 start_codon:yes stop_codon:yes gene_type:complete